LRAFFERCYPRLVRFLYARLGDTDQAEDLAQEAFIRLLRVRPRDREAWLFTVARNLARDHVRLESGRARHLMLIQAAAEPERDADPDRELGRIQEACRVREALSALSERDRILLLLHHDGFRYREIAQRLGLAPTSIGSLLTRAQRRFVDSYHTISESHARRGSG
jgi:RNA polymerase sigma-70 factor (ECF subfamily)